MNGNARIEKTMIGVEDHGIMTCYLYLRQEGAGQPFGGFALDGPYDHEKKERKPNAYCGLWIKRILEVVGVSKWEDLPGKYVRVAGEEWGRIDGIGNIIEDRWFYPKKDILEAAKDGGV